MRRSFPSIGELRAFEAAARHLSMTAAARELGITQGAVSKQISSLERLLGVMLFERGNQRIALTVSGQMFLGRLKPALEQIGAAVHERQGDAPRAPQAATRDL